MKMFHHLHSPNFDILAKTLSWLFIEGSHEVHPDHWQGMNVRHRPEMKSHELLNVTMQVPLLGDEELDHWRRDVKPNLPWADNHFEERVCGQPINPGVEWANWPWGESARRFIENGGQFNHNYMERYWPKYAGNTPDEDGRYDTLGAAAHAGIRNVYGDLNDVVELLCRDQLTRQAWLPIFFPEDTGVGDGGRKPCTLGYQFLCRDKRLHVYYPLRSCDFIRHWRDDVYLTVRLLLWVLDRCRQRDPSRWNDVAPGMYTMYTGSLHIFENDWRQLGA